MSPDGRLRRALKNLSASSDELEAAELQRACLRQGWTPIAAAKEREFVTLYGTIKTVSLAPRAGTPTLEAAMYDGSGTVTIVWLGRRKIAGIKPGTALTISGRLSGDPDSRVMFNPRYELQA